MQHLIDMASEDCTDRSPTVKALDGISRHHRWTYGSVNKADRRELNEQSPDCGASGLEKLTGSAAGTLSRFLRCMKTHGLACTGRKALGGSRQ